MREVWAVGTAYERYIGRWSRPIAREFVRWLALPRECSWLDVGSGTGALTGAIAELAGPRAILGIDRSEGFVQHLRAEAPDSRWTFEVGDARALPVATGSCDAVVSGLVLNFVETPKDMLAEMCRVGRDGSTVAVYVWDYGSGMELLRRFWDAATRLDPSAAPLDEAVRFPICAPGPLRILFEQAGLAGVAVRGIEVPTPFRDFDDYWAPFLGGQGPAPTYAMSLTTERRHALREALRASLPTSPDGSIRLGARAWAVRGTKLHHPPPTDP